MRHQPSRQHRQVPHYLYAGATLIYMQVHDYLYAGVSLFVCSRMIFYLQTQQTTAQQASEPDTGEHQKRHGEHRKRNRQVPIQTAARAYRHQTGTTKYNADNSRSVGRHNATTYIEEGKEPRRVSYIHVSQSRGHSKEKHKQHNHLQIIISHS